MSAEKFLVYFLLILVYVVYAQFNGNGERVNADRGRAVASVPQPAAPAAPRAVR